MNPQLKCASVGLPGCLARWRSRGDSANKFGIPLAGARGRLILLATSVLIDFLRGQPVVRDFIASLSGFIAIVKTAKHRLFQFFDASIAPDNMLVCIALDDAYTLGVLSSRVHVVWALATGGTLEDRPRYNKSRCFETFPFPDFPSPQPSPACGGGSHASRIAALAEHPDLTLNGLYNVLEKLRMMENVGRKSGLIAPSAECVHVSLSEGAALFRPTNAPSASLTAKEKDIHQRGLVGVLQSLHAELDAEVLAAFGWSDLLPSPAGGGGVGGEGAFPVSSPDSAPLLPGYKTLSCWPPKPPGRPACRNRSLPSPASWPDRPSHCPKSPSLPASAARAPGRNACRRCWKPWWRWAARGWWMVRMSVSESDVRDNVQSVRHFNGVAHT